MEGFSKRWQTYGKGYTYAYLIGGGPIFKTMATIYKTWHIHDMVKWTNNMAGFCGHIQRLANIFIILSTSI